MDSADLMITWPRRKACHVCPHAERWPGGWIRCGYIGRVLEAADFTADRCPLGKWNGIPLRTLGPVFAGDTTLPPPSRTVPAADPKRRDTRLMVCARCDEWNGNICELMLENGRCKCGTSFDAWLGRADAACPLGRWTIESEQEQQHGNPALA